MTVSPSWIARDGSRDGHGADSASAVVEDVVGGDGGERDTWPLPVVVSSA